MDVLRAYYRAIADRQFPRAYAYWGTTGPPNQTLEAFTNGFRDTAAVEITPGKPSRIEGAAGSRYIEIPVTVVARTNEGETQRFEGTYTLRRSVVEGAGANRTWHLYRASMRKVGA